MRIEQRPKQQISGRDKANCPKQRKVSALFGAIFFCFKTVQNKAPTNSALLALFVLSPANKCMAHFIQLQDVTTAHNSPTITEW